MRFLFVCVVALTLVACPSSKDAGPGANPKPSQPSLVERGLRVEVSAVSLADDCDGLPAGLAADCDPGGDCSLPCQQTSMQMSFGSDGPTQAVAVKILEVRLFAKETGELVDKLSARAPSRWVDDDGSYQSWDEQLPPNADTKAKYDLGAPDWAEIDHTPNTLFYIEVDVEIDGTVTTVESDELSREPQIVT